MDGLSQAPHLFYVAKTRMLVSAIYVHCTIWVLWLVTRSEGYSDSAWISGTGGKDLELAHSLDLGIRTTLSQIATWATLELTVNRERCIAPSDLLLDNTCSSVNKQLALLCALYYSWTTII